MNKQAKKLKDGTIGRGIEWTDYTWNPIKGCFHACQWTMPDGTIANCYAEDVAGKFNAAYPDGFEHHYWKPELLTAPERVKQPAKIFVGSMADVFGHWVPDEQIYAVLAMCRRAHWHTFQFLTKNPRRTERFDFPPNAWIGASTPPDFMWNKALTTKQQTRMMHATFLALEERPIGRIAWLSAEPLSWDIVPVLEEHQQAIDWIVIGAASNGKTYYPPNEAYVRRLVEFCDGNDAGHPIKVFFKGNMRSLAWAAANWREEFPYEPRSARLTAPPDPTTAHAVHSEG